MRIFITGANGFIGGAVAGALIDGGHHVRGLVRDNAKAIAVAARGIEPVIGTLDDAALLQQARDSGVVRYIGRGLTRWSNVHIADVAALYALALVKAPAASFIFVENGEQALGEVAQAIAARLDLSPAQSWPAEAAIEARGREKATFSLGSNSRVRGTAAAALGWVPRHRSITDWIARELV